MYSLIIYLNFYLILGYDGVFVMNYIINNILPKDSQPYIISKGSKLLSIRFRGVRIIDSYSFIPIPLAQFPSAFGIDELKKGFFPHIFNTMENQNYIGEQHPERHYYAPQFFSTAKLQEFDTWYNEVKNKPFDFQREFQDYCWSDVFLLASGCIKFRKTILDLTEKLGNQEQESIDPFENSVTIASLCHLIFRSFVLRTNTIAYIPEKGYDNEKVKKNLLLLSLFC